MKATNIPTTNYTLSNIPMDILTKIVKGLEQGQLNCHLSDKYNIKEQYVSKIKRVEIDKMEGYYIEYPYAKLKNHSEEEKNTLRAKAAERNKKLEEKRNADAKIYIPPTVKSENPIKKTETSVAAKPKFDKLEAAKKHPELSKLPVEYIEVKSVSSNKAIEVNLFKLNNGKKTIFENTEKDYKQINYIIKKWINLNIKFIASKPCYCVKLYVDSSKSMDCNLYLSAVVNECYNRSINLTIVYCNSKDNTIEENEQIMFNNFEQHKDPTNVEKLKDAFKESDKLFCYKSIESITKKDLVYCVTEKYWLGGPNNYYETILFAEKDDAWLYIMEKAEEKFSAKTLYFNDVSIKDGEFVKGHLYITKSKFDK